MPGTKTKTWATCPDPKLRLGELEDDVAVLHSGSRVSLGCEGDGHRAGQRRAACR